MSKVRPSGCRHDKVVWEFTLVADDTESQSHLPGSPGSLWADIGAACPQSWEFSGDEKIRLRGNSRNSVNGIKGPRPKNRASMESGIQCHVPPLHNVFFGGTFLTF